MGHNTSADWDNSLPTDNETIDDGAKEIRLLRTGVQDRSGKEHAQYAASGAGGEHKAGSAKAYYASSAPTNRPDGSTALTSGDEGRLFFKSDDGDLWVWTGSAFERVKIFNVAALVADLFTADTAGRAPFQDGVINTAKLADDAVTTVKITDANVTTDKIADSNVTTAKVADANITRAKLASDAFWCPYARYSYTASANSGGGNDFSANLTWGDIHVNNEDEDDDGIGSLASNIITLGEGTFYVRFKTCFAGSNAAKAALCRENDSELILGTIAHSGSTTINAWSTGEGKITLTAGQGIKIRGIVTTNYNAAYINGVVNNLGGKNNVHTIIEVWKIDE